MEKKPWKIQYSISELSQNVILAQGTAYWWCGTWANYVKRSNLAEMARVLENLAIIVEIWSNKPVLANSNSKRAGVICTGLFVYREDDFDLNANLKNSNRKTFLLSIQSVENACVEPLLVAAFNTIILCYLAVLEHEKTTGRGRTRERESRVSNENLENEQQLTSLKWFEIRIGHGIGVTYVSESNVNRADSIMWIAKSGKTAHSVDATRVCYVSSSIIPRKWRASDGINYLLFTSAELKCTCIEMEYTIRHQIIFILAITFRIKNGCRIDLHARRPCGQSIKKMPKRKQQMICPSIK